MLTRFATVLLVDRAGRLLLQERDEHAPIEPELWGLVGGHVDPGEQIEPAAYRELAEETGLRLPPGTLRLYDDFPTSHPSYGTGRNWVWTARVDLTDADIVVGEGRQIVFVDPARARGLPLAAAAADAVPAFLDSVLYASMTR